MARGSWGPGAGGTCRPASCAAAGSADARGSPPGSGPAPARSPRCRTRRSGPRTRCWEGRGAAWSRAARQGLPQRASPGLAPRSPRQVRRRVGPRGRAVAGLAAPADAVVAGAEAARGRAGARSCAGHLRAQPCKAGPGWVTARLARGHPGPHNPRPAAPRSPSRSRTCRRRGGPSSGPDWFPCTEGSSTRDIHGQNSSDLPGQAVRRRRGPSPSPSRGPRLAGRGARTG